MMKTERFVLILLAIAALSACVKEQDIDLISGDDVVFTATWEGSAASRTQLSEDGKAVWSPSDAIRIYYGDSSQAEFTATNTEAAETALFQGSLEGWTPGGDQVVWAVYPSLEGGSCDGSSVTVFLPEEQEAVAGSFADDLFICIATSNNYQLYFRNLCGGIKFRITEADVVSVSFRGNAGEPLAGQARVMMENGIPYVDAYPGSVSPTLTLTAPAGESFQTGAWYYITSLPARLSQGYRMVLTKRDGTATVRESRNPVEIKRSVWGVLDKLDEGLIYEERIPENEIWYTTTDGQTTDFWDGDPYQLVANLYENGKGRFIFDRALTHIPAYFAQDNSSLQSVSLPEGITEIGEDAFYGCSNLTAINFPSGLQKIGREAFNSCALQEALLPEGLQELGDGVFSGCGQLTRLHIPGSVTSVGYACCFFCPSLSELLLGEGIREIQEWAFIDCSGITELTLPQSLEVIGPAAFGNIGVKKITIPAHVRELSDAFSGCDLEEVNVLASVPPSVSSDCFAGLGYQPWGDEPIASFPIYIPAGSEEAYQLADGWKDFSGRMYTPGGTLVGFYTSTDYSRDGELVTLQQATKGSGYNVVFLGDGFIDKDMEPGGKYEQQAAIAMNTLWILEPFRSLRDRFNLYAIKVVSENPVYGDRRSKRRLTYNDGWNYAYEYEVYHDVVEEYLANCHLEDALFVLCCNTGMTTFRSYAGIGVVMGIPISSTGGFAQTFNHEMGHAVGHLGDEYGWADLNSLPDEGAKENMDQRHQERLLSNIDYHDTPETVCWAHFLKDARYADEGLGVFLGAGGDGMHGYYRPDENSIMRANRQDGREYFNAPSREAIYYHVMEKTEGPSWQYDYETFVAFDAAGRKQAADFRAGLISY